jgi:hypothetical protein
VKVLFFSPFSNVWEHSFPEALVAESFAKQAVEVKAVRCGTLLQTHCVAMSAAGVGPEASLETRQQVCRACIKRRELIAVEMGLPELIMDDWVTKEDRALVDELTAKVRPDDWTELEIDGIPLGRYAAYELWINNKLVSTTLPPEVWLQYLGQLRNTLLTFLLGKRIIAAEQPQAVVVYNDHYSVNHAFCAAARLAGVPTYTIHGGQHMARRAETLSMFTSDYTMEDVFRSTSWQRYRSAPIGQAEVDLVGEHFSGLLAASSGFVYSSKFKGTGAPELRMKLGIEPGVPVLLATMSSEDELMAVRLIDAIPSTIAQKSLFSDQFEWVEYLFGYAKDHPEVHLVLRLHPRMFPNKRESVLSPVVSRIMAMRDLAPANLTFNMPSDGIGLYDLMQIVDVLLNFRSSVGAELAAFGIPVVVPSNADFYTYPDEINRIGNDKEEYLEAINQALAEGWSIENARRSFRWFAFLFSRVAVDLSEAVHSRPVAVRPKKPGIRLWLWKKMVFVILQYGPLLRERLALRGRRLSASSQAILLDVIESKLDSASESLLWPPVRASVKEETRLIESHLLELCATLWRDISEPDSLAGKIRISLGKQSE